MKWKKNFKHYFKIINNNNIDKNCDFNSFDQLINEFKLRTSNNIEESIVFIFLK